MEQNNSFCEGCRFFEIPIFKEFCQPIGYEQFKNNDERLNIIRNFVYRRRLGDKLRSALISLDSLSSCANCQKNQFSAPQENCRFINVYSWFENLVFDNVSGAKIESDRVHRLTVISFQFFDEWPPATKRYLRAMQSYLMSLANKKQGAKDE